MCVDFPRAALRLRTVAHILVPVTITPLCVHFAMASRRCLVALAIALLLCFAATILFMQTTIDLPELWPPAEFRPQPATSETVTDPPGEAVLSTAHRVLIAQERQRLADQGTSLFCQGSSHDDRHCTARNLCFETARREFVALHSGLSVFDGVPARPFSLPFVDMTAIFDHNTQHMSFTDVAAASITKRPDVYLVPGTSLLFRRFNPSNIMHVLHDDMIPLFVTLRQMGGGAYDDVLDRAVQLVYFEGWAPGPYLHLLSLLSDKVASSEFYAMLIIL